MTKDELLAVIERSVKTFAQSLVAFILASEVTSVIEVDWKQAAGVAALAAVLSLLTSIGSWHFGPAPGPSLVGEVPLDEHLKYKNEVLQADMEAEMDRLVAEERGE